ncbi:MAG: hypothetical protein ACLGH6_00210 [Gammaproteobacteria bacterium]
MSKSGNCSLCWWLLAIVVILAAVAGYRLIMGGHTHPSSDGRAEIALAPADRDLVLAEMRGFLSAVQGITAAVSRDDLAAAAGHARGMGLAAVGQIPVSLMQALPLEFKQLGNSVHADLDQLALDAEQLGDRDHTLRQLGDILNKCVACHAAYRLSPTGAGH